MAGEELEVLPPIINVGALVAALDERGHRCGRARATAGGESGGTWGPNGFEPDGRAVDPSQVGFTGDEREVDLV